MSHEYADLEWNQVLIKLVLLWIISCTWKLRVIKWMCLVVI